MNWNPDGMTYGELERARDEADLCRSCRHQDVCPVPAELSRREGWFLAVATCGHHEADGEPTAKDDAECANCEQPINDHDCPISLLDGGGEEDAELLALADRWRLLWAEVGAAMARQALTYAEAEPGKHDVVVARRNEQLCTRELQAARRLYREAEEAVGQSDG